MRYIILSEFELEDFLKTLTPNELRKLEFFSTNNLLAKRLQRKKFSLFLVLFGSVVFLFSLVFQFVTNSIENQQILSSKPYFHIVTGFIFAFEITLLLCGIILFIHFFLLNFYHNKTIPEGIRDVLDKLRDNQVLLLFYDDVNEIPHILGTELTKESKKS